MTYQLSRPTSYLTLFAALSAITEYLTPAPVAGERMESERAGVVGAPWWWRLRSQLTSSLLYPWLARAIIFPPLAYPRGGLEPRCRFFERSVRLWRLELDSRKASVISQCKPSIFWVPSSPYAATAAVRVTPAGVVLALLNLTFHLKGSKSEKNHFLSFKEPGVPFRTTSAMKFKCTI